MRSNLNGPRPPPPKFPKELSERQHLMESLVLRVGCFGDFVAPLVFSWPFRWFSARFGNFLAFLVFSGWFLGEFLGVSVILWLFEGFSGRFGGFWAGLADFLAVLGILKSGSWFFGRFQWGFGNHFGVCPAIGYSGGHFGPFPGRFESCPLNSAHFRPFWWPYGTVQRGIQSMFTLSQYCGVQARSKSTDRFSLFGGFACCLLAAGCLLLVACCLLDLEVST